MRDFLRKIKIGKSMKTEIKPKLSNVLSTREKAAGNHFCKLLRYSILTARVLGLDINLLIKNLVGDLET